MMEIPSNQQVNTRQSQSQNFLIYQEISSIIAKKNINYGSYIRIKTSIPFFKPTYLLSRLTTFHHEHPSKTKHRKKKMNPDLKLHKTKIIEDDFILNYGSQLFLQSYQYLAQFKKSIDVSFENIVPFFEEFLFAEILIEGKYLTKINESVILKQEPSSEGIWSIEEEGNGRIRIVNVVDRSYLTLDRDKKQLSFSETCNIYCLFHIEPIINSNNYILTPVNPRQTSGKNLDELSTEKSFQIELMPINDSALSIHYQLKFAEWMLQNEGSMAFIRNLINQLIFYDIPEFKENQTLLSEHIQALFKEYGILEAIVEYLIKQINSEIIIEKQLCKMLRLLCLNSKSNTLVVSRIIDKLLSFNFFFKEVFIIIKGNYYFGAEFQRREWYSLIIERISFFLYTSQHQQIWNVYELLSQFCNLSTSNKYLIMHTFESSESEKNEMMSMTNYSVDPSSLWLRVFSEGLYLFVITEKNKKFQEIELNTFLNDGDSLLEKQLFVAQLKLIQSFCSGFNINALDRYNSFLKSLAPYLYKQNFPILKDSLLVKTILTAIAESYAPPVTLDKYAIQYSLGKMTIEKKRKSNLGGDPSEKKMMSIYQQLKNLYNWIERKFLRQLERNQSIDQICRQSSIERNSILAELKIVELCLGARLITVTKRKEAQFMEYIKKIFENVNQPKNSSKKNQSSKVSEYSFESSEEIKNKKQQFPIYGIMSFLQKIIAHCPIYEGYLKVMRIARQQANKLNDVLNKLIKKSTFQLKGQQQVGENIDKNDYISYIFKQVFLQRDMTVNQTQEIQFLQYYDQIKLTSYRSLCLIYQNILEEQLEYSVQSLSYLIKHPNQINSKFTFDISFKYPMIDSFKLILLQQWYIESDLQIFNEITHCIRYIYDQNQIYSRAVNNILLIADSDLSKLSHSISSTMEAIEKLSQTIYSWFLPTILEYYEDNYRNLIRCLQYINGQFRKQIINDRLQLLDYQTLLNNLKLIPICLNIISHTHKYENILKYPSTIEKIIIVHEEITKILQFYVFQSQHNCKKVIISLGEYLTKSTSLFPFFILIINYRNKSVLDYYSRLSELNLLMSDKMIENIISSLPSSKYYLDNLLHLDDVSFVKAISRIMKNQKNIKILQSKQYLEEFTLGYQFREFIHKIAYRLLQITNCCQQFICWYYNHFLRLILIQQCKANLHFKSKIIKSLSLEYVYEHSFIACNLFLVLKMNKEKKKKYGAFVNNEEGTIVIIEYIIGQLLASILSPPPQIFIHYIGYYFYDLLPLSMFSRDILKIGDMSDKILQNIEEYAKILEKNMEIKSQNMRNIRDSLSEGEKNEIERDKKLQSTNYGKVDLKIENIEEIPEKDYYINKIRKYIQTGINFDDSFRPRPIKLQMVISESKFKNEKKLSESNVQNLKLSSEKLLQKKAIKKWYKARLYFNEKIASLGQKGIQKWLIDISNVELQFDEEHQEKVINSRDILHKLYQSAINLSRLHFSKENQIFLMRCILVHLKEILSKKNLGKKKKNKSKGNTAEKRKKEISEKVQSYKIVKGLKVKDLLKYLMEEAAYKLQNQQNNPLSIVLLLTIINICFQIELCQFENYVVGISNLLDLCREMHVYHREIIKIYQNQQTLETIFADSYPLIVCLQISDNISELRTLSDQNIINLATELIKIRWEFPDLEKTVLEIQEKLKSFNAELYEQVIENILSGSEYYQAISTL